MDIKSPHATTPKKLKLEPELARYQRVLDAYHAHPGEAPEPSGTLDQLILSRAQVAHAASKSTRTQSAKRRWPMALAASVATIGFAAILARHSLREPAPSYDVAPAVQERQAVARSADDTEAKLSAGAPATPSTSTSVPAAPDIVVESRKRESSPPSTPRPEPQKAPAPAGVSTTAADDSGAEPELLRAAQANEADLHDAETDGVSEQLSSRDIGAEETIVPEPKPVASANAKRVEVQPGTVTAPTPAPAVAMPTPPLAAPASPVASETKEDSGDATAPLGGMRTNQSEMTNRPSDEKPEAAATYEGARAAGRGALGLSTDADALLFTQVRALRAQGDIKQARLLLKKFQLDHPEKIIPEDLLDLLTDEPK